MTRSRSVIAALLVASGLLLATVVPAVTATVPALSVSVSCYSNPERTNIHNNRSAAITIRSVGSLYRPYSNEPFYVYQKLAAHHSITYYTGSGASSSNPHTLTRRYIYNNSVGTAEGVRVITTGGLRFIRRC